MSDSNIADGMLDMFLYETEQMLEQLEVVTMNCEKEQKFDSDSVNEIFRVMHTIKGSSGIMMMTNITQVSHKLEDVFYYIRQNHIEDLPCAELIGIIFNVSDFINCELEKIKAGQEPDEDPTDLVEKLKEFLEELKKMFEGGGAPEVKKEPAPKEKTQPSEEVVETNLSEVDGNSKFYLIQIFYREDTEMSNVKAYSVVFALKDIARDMRYEPLDIDTDESTGDVILKEGFKIALHSTGSKEDVLSRVDHSAGVDKIEVNECTREEFEHLLKSGRLDFGKKASEAFQELEEAEKSQEPEEKSVEKVVKKSAPAAAAPAKKPVVGNHATQSFISVNVEKMDLLMDLIGEMVIAEAVVLQNPDLNVPGLDLTNFNKQAAQLSKITSELQDAIMSIRMMPLTNTFQKMNRIVYDTSRKLGKDIDLKIIGEGTEVDKNIIEHISDPLMHMIRNSVDHGIESKEARAQAGKAEKGTITLEAKNEGGKVWICVSDDGKGLSKKALLKKAAEQGMLEGRSEKELSDKEIYNLITLPGFSTKEKVTEYSGRGVGMDVVMKNIQSIGGSLEIDSKEGFGSTMTMKIPLTLAIIDGIILSVGDNTYAVATEDIKEFVSITNEQMIVEPDGTESIMLRGECYPVLRLKTYYHLEDGVDNVEEGIMAILEYEGKRLALFIDKLIGEQEIVVKPIPSYIKKVKGLSGCTQLGDGSISLILDTGSMINS